MYWEKIHEQIRSGLALDGTRVAAASADVSRAPTPLENFFLMWWTAAFWLR